MKTPPHWADNIADEELAETLLPFLHQAPRMSEFETGAAYLEALQAHLFARAGQIFDLVGREWSWDSIYAVGDDLIASPDSEGINRVQTAAMVAVVAASLCENTKGGSPEDRVAHAVDGIVSIFKLDTKAFLDLRRYAGKGRSKRANAAKTAAVSVRLDRIRQALKAGCRRSPVHLIRALGLDDTPKMREKIRADLERLGKRPTAPTGNRR